MLALWIVVGVVVLCLVALFSMRHLPSRPGRGGLEEDPGPWDGGGGPLGRS